MGKTRDCDMCIEKAVLFCVATGKRLCWDCDQSSDWQVYNIIRHARFLICRLCHLVTPWQVSDLEDDRSPAFCYGCRASILRARRMKLMAKGPQFRRRPPTESASSSQEEQRHPDESSSSFLLSNRSAGEREASEEEEDSYCPSVGPVSSSNLRKRPASPSSHCGGSPRRQKVVRYEFSISDTEDSSPRNAAEEGEDRPTSPVLEPPATKVRPSFRRRIDIRVYRSLLRKKAGDPKRS